MIIGIQIIGIMFSFSMIYFAILHFKRREISVMETTVWVFVWLFVFFALIFPDLLQPFAKTFLFARLFDMMVVGAFVLVMLMVLRTYISMRKIEKTIEKMVRNDSINKAIKNVK